jgi:glutathione S-transferase
MMIKLYGFTASNYHNKVKLALLEKEVPFEEVAVFASQEETFIARSPMGKVPYIEVDGATLSESQVIVEYLEDAYPAHPLYPLDAFARGKCRELIQTLELHLELQVRRLYPEVISGRKVSDDIKADVNAQVEKGVRALAQLARFDPYIAGPELTLADCAALVHLPMVSQATKTIFGRDYLEGITAIPGYLAMLKQRPHVRKVLDERKVGMQQFMERVERMRAAAK